MKLSDVVDASVQLARPFATAVCGFAVALGVFVHSVGADKLWAAGAVATGISVARGLDKRMHNIGGSDGDDI